MQQEESKVQSSCLSNSWTFKKVGALGFMYHEIIWHNIKMQYINNITIRRMVKLSGRGKAQCCNFKAYLLNLHLKSFKTMLFL